MSARGIELLFNRGVVRPFPDLAARKAADIGPGDIQQILARLLGRGLTRDVNVLRAYLRAAFQFGSEQDFDPATLARDGVAFQLKTNPVTLIPRKAEFDRTRDRVLTDEELRHLWAGPRRTRPACTQRCQAGPRARRTAHDAVAPGTVAGLR